MSHMQGFIELVDGSGGSRYLAGAEKMKFGIRHEIVGISSCMNSDNLHHIVACWNACHEASLPTSFLESGGIARLVKALTVIKQSTVGPTAISGVGQRYFEVVEIAKAALAGIPQREEVSGE